MVVLADGRLFEGIVIKQDGGKVAIYPGKVGAEPVVVAKDDIDEIRPSKVSQMPENLLDKLNAQEVKRFDGVFDDGRRRQPSTIQKIEERNGWPGRIRIDNQKCIWSRHCCLITF